MNHDIAQISYDLSRIDGMTRGVAGTISRVAEHIAALERDRALLLAYVRAHRDYSRAITAAEKSGDWSLIDHDGSMRERVAAWQAIEDAGLLEGDDDGE